MSTHTARFYMESITNGTVSLPSEIRRHAKALRVQEGDMIELFDGTHEYSARFQGQTAEVLRKSEAKGIPSAQLTLAIAFPKGNRADWLVEKATELGVSTIIPLLSKYAIVDPRETKVARLQKLAITACEQSGRTTIPNITEPRTLTSVLAGSYDTKIFCFIDGKKEMPSGKNILIIVGPEGGFADAEVEQMKKSGCISVALGHATLRTETAGIAALTLAGAR
jgi:16S rRNA (uracil1498-N3)-methyltransferase